LVQADELDDTLDLFHRFGNEQMTDFLEYFEELHPRGMTSFRFTYHTVIRFTVFPQSFDYNIRIQSIQTVTKIFPTPIFTEVDVREQQFGQILEILTPDQPASFLIPLLDLLAEFFQNSELIEYILDERRFDILLALLRDVSHEEPIATTIDLFHRGIPDYKDHKSLPYVFFRTVSQLSPATPDAPVAPFLALLNQRSQLTTRSLI
jgi:hypothetical protein